MKTIILKNISKTASNPVEIKNKNGNSIILGFRAENISKEQIPDKTEVIDIHSGYKVVIPTGYVGLLTPTVEMGGSSLMAASSPIVIQPDVEADIFIPFKLTTNAAPAVVRTHKPKTDKSEEELGGVFCVLTLINSVEFNYSVESPEETPEQSDKTIGASKDDAMDAETEPTGATESK